MRYAESDLREWLAASESGNSEEMTMIDNTLELALAEAVESVEAGAGAR